MRGLQNGSDRRRFWWDTVDTVRARTRANPPRRAPVG